MIKEKRTPSATEAWLTLAILPIVFGIGCIGMGMRMEMMLILVTVISAIEAKRLGYSYDELQNAICHMMVNVTPTILVMFMVGVVIATFMFSGSIPMMIHFGMEMINPKYFYVCAFLACVLSSIITGTSWGSIGTIGIAMMGVAIGFGLPLNATAAALIAGALVGDKLSPLSDTTILAPMCAGTTIWKHIGSMLWTTIPTALISLVFYYILGKDINITAAELPAEAQEIMVSLTDMYDFNFLLIIPFVIIVVGSLMKMPSVPTLLISGFSAIILGVVIQGFSPVDGMLCAVTGFKTTMAKAEGTAILQTLLNRGGMHSNINQVVVIYCGYAYAGVVTKSGILQAALDSTVGKVKSVPGLITAALATEFAMLCCSGGSQAASIVVGNVYRKPFVKNGIDLRVLSRCMEDVGTMIAPLIPWGASGVFYVTTLNVPIWGEGGYGLLCVNTWSNPIMGLILAFTGIGVYRLTEEQKKKELEKIAEIEASL